MAQSMAMMRIALSILLLFYIGSSHAATVYYLHGKIVEDRGDNAIHPIYGKYKYGEIVAQLRREGHTVHSEVRPPETDRVAYATRLVNQIRHQIKSGLRPAEIVVIGFSKGAQIAILVSQELALSDVRFVFQAVCGSWVQHFADLKVHGNIMSLYETTDTAGSCANLFSRSNPTTCEVSITTGQKHGAFYRPNEAWMAPQREWLDQGICRS